MRDASRRKAVLALLLDKFHLPLRDYARLTDRQIFDLYLHARKSDGSIDTSVPLFSTTPGEEASESDTLESELATLALVAKTFNLPPAEHERLQRELKAKYGRTAAPAG